MDEIVIQGLQVSACVGVPDAERAMSQQLEMNLAIQPRLSFSHMEDNLLLTVDYDSVAQRVAALAAERPRRLIETLAAEIAQTLLQEFRAHSVMVEVRKFILPQTRYVAVKCRASIEPGRKI